MSGSLRYTIALLWGGDVEVEAYEARSLFTWNSGFDTLVPHGSLLGSQGRFPSTIVEFRDGGNLEMPKAKEPLFSSNHVIRFSRQNPTMTSDSGHS